MNKMDAVHIEATRIFLKGLNRAIDEVQEWYEGEAILAQHRKEDLAFEARCSIQSSNLDKEEMELLEFIIEDWLYEV